jgi:hypothetical protein
LQLNFAIVDQKFNIIENAWFFDNKSTQQMNPHKEWFDSYKLLDQPLTMYMGDG